MKVVSLIIITTIIIYYGLLFLGALFFSIYKEYRDNGKE